MRGLVLLLAFVGCGQGAKEQTPPPKSSSSPTSASETTTGPAPACAEATKKLSAYLTDLDADGVIADEYRPPDGIELVKLDGAPPSQLPSATALILTRSEIRLNGRLLATLPIKDKGKSLAAAVTKIQFDEGSVDHQVFQVVVDRNVPWSAVATAASVAETLGARKLAFVFLSEVRHGKATRPPHSAIDGRIRDFSNPDEPPRPVQADPEAPPLPHQVFKDCLKEDVLATINRTNWPAKSKVIVDEIPRMVSACNCGVDLASVQSLMWAWYERGALPTTSVTLDVDKSGAKLTAKATTTWAQASKSVIDAAKVGKPVAIE